MNSFVGKYVFSIFIRRIIVYQRRGHIRRTAVCRRRVQKEGGLEDGFLISVLNIESCYTRPFMVGFMAEAPSGL